MARRLSGEKACEKAHSLVFAQNCTLTIEGNVLTVVETFKKDPSGGARKACKGFSDRSRSSMLAYLNKAIFGAVQMVTLTYHENEKDPAVAKGDLRKFHERVRRKYGDLHVVWKLEFQKRGACHFHMIVFDAEIDTVWASVAWAGCIGDPTDKHHLMYGVRVERVISVSAAEAGVIIAYVLKYTAKKESDKDGSDDRFTGRCWGVWGRTQPAVRRQKAILPSAIPIVVSAVVSHVGTYFENPACRGYRIYLGHMGREYSGSVDCDLPDMLDGIFEVKTGE